MRAASPVASQAGQRRSFSELLGNAGAIVTESRERRHDLRSLLSELDRLAARPNLKTKEDLRSLQTVKPEEAVERLETLFSFNSCVLVDRLAI
jgi:hypothetical protein